MKATNRKGFSFWLLTLGSIALFLFIAISSVRQESATTDETWHLAAGMTLLRTGDFRMNTDNPYFPNALAALPLALNKNFKVPSTEDKTFKNAQIFYYGQKMAEMNGGIREGEKFSLLPDQLLLPRAVMISCAALFLLIFAFLLQRYFNRVVAIIAVILLGFSPVFMAHARLTTTDVPVAITIFLTSFVLWRLHRASTVRTYLLLLPVFLVLSFISLMTKYTALFFAPFWLMLLGYSAFEKTSLRPLMRVLSAIAISICVVGFWVLGVYAAYGFTYKTLRQTRHNDYVPIKEDKRILLAQKYGEQLVRLYDTRKLPAPYYLQGVLFNVIFKDIQGHESFFLGKYQNVGPGYYLLAFLTKETIPLIVGAIIFLCWLLVLVYQGKHRKDILFLGIPPLVIALVFSFSNVKIGIRHILPVYPFLVLGIAIMVDRFIKRGGLSRRVVVYLGAFSIFLSILYVYPYYLSYFNFLVGGSRNGYKLLQDSNYDWGQNEVRAQQIADRSNGKIQYSNQIMPEPGKYYLVRLINLYTITTNRDVVSAAFRKLFDEKKLRVIEYSLPTHWLVYYP